MTLRAFVDTYPTQRAAAKAIGVPPMTLWRWLQPKNNHGQKPRGLYAVRLRDLGVTVK